MSVLRIATRGSDLALAQARSMAARIEAELSLQTELVVITTTGDRIQDVSLAKVGGKGLFVKEIEQALLEDRADLAVHSAKDLTASVPPGLALVAFPEREDPRDALVSRSPNARVERLPEGARVGTGSARRTALLRAARPDLEIVPLRGNVPTRIAKLDSEGLHAVVLACAGLRRLGLGHEIREAIAPETMLPAVCQGTLALEMRADDPRFEAVASLADPAVARAAAAERAFLARLEGDCTVPLAVYAEEEAEEEGAGALRVRGLLARPDGSQVLRAERTGPPEQAADLGDEVAQAILADGGRALLEALADEDEA